MTTTTLAHESFCLPRPGADEPRVEQFSTTRDDGMVAHTLRCIECGSQVITWLGKL